MADLASFQVFLTDVAGIDAATLPVDSPVIAQSYNAALATVNQNFLGLPLQYDFAVYNLATDLILNFALDQPNAQPMKGSNPPTPFFAWYRRQLNVAGFVGGVVNATSDQGTSQSMQLPEMMEYLTFSDLQRIKTPFGRAYLAIIGDQGNLWGLS